MSNRAVGIHESLRIVSLMNRGGMRRIAATAKAVRVWGSAPVYVPVYVNELNRRLLRREKSVSALSA